MVPSSLAYEPLDTASENCPHYDGADGADGAAVDAVDAAAVDAATAVVEAAGIGGERMQSDAAEAVPRNLYYGERRWENHFDEKREEEDGEEGEEEAGMEEEEGRRLSGRTIENCHFFQDFFPKCA